MRQSNYLNSYRSEFEKKFSSCKAVSFDVFDTILLRPCLRAVDMFRLVQKRCGLDNSFPDIRQKAEWMVRNESAASEEITLTEIYKKIQNFTFWTLLGRGYVQWYNKSRQLGGGVYTSYFS